MATVPNKKLKKYILKDVFLLPGIFICERCSQSSAHVRLIGNHHLCSDRSRQLCEASFFLHSVYMICRLQ